MIFTSAATIARRYAQGDALSRKLIDDHLERQRLAEREAQDRG